MAVERVSSSQMLLQVLASSKAFTSATNTIRMRTEQWSPGRAHAFLVHFPHVA